MKQLEFILLHRPGFVQVYDIDNSKETVLLNNDGVYLQLLHEITVLGTRSDQKKTHKKKKKKKKKSPTAGKIDVRKQLKYVRYSKPVSQYCS